MTQNEEKNKSIKSNPKITQMIAVTMFLFTISIINIMKTR